MNPSCFDTRVAEEVMTDLLQAFRQGIPVDGAAYYLRCGALPTSDEEALVLTSIAVVVHYRHRNETPAVEKEAFVDYMTRVIDEESYEVRHDHGPRAAIGVRSPVPRPRRKLDA